MVDDIQVQAVVADRDRGSQEGVEEAQLLRRGTPLQCLEDQLPLPTSSTSPPPTHQLEGKPEDKSVKFHPVMKRNNLV